MGSHFGNQLYIPTPMAGSARVEDPIRHLHILSGRTFVPGKQHRPCRIILPQQRLRISTRLLAVGGLVGVVVAYQGKGSDH